MMLTLVLMVVEPFFRLIDENFELFTTASLKLIVAKELVNTLVAFAFGIELDTIGAVVSAAAVTTAKGLYPSMLPTKRVAG